MVKPIGNSSVAESQNERDNENKIRLTPNPAVETATQRPRPYTLFRAAKLSAPSNAPNPDAPINSPRLPAPPRRISAAKIGINTAYGVPNKLIAPKSKSNARTGPVRQTKRTPSTTCAKGDPGRATFRC